jgi:2-methylcitrate synthase
MPDQPTIHRGLDGVVVDSTRISKVMPEINSLVYFGYPVQDLAEHCNFEEVAWLLWHGELPNAQQLAAFQTEGRSRRHLSPELLAVIQKAPRNAHPMDLLRTAVSFFGMEDPAPEKEDAVTNLDRSISLLAKIPIILGTFYRVRKGLDIIPPRSDLTFAQNFFHICFGEVPPPEVIRAFEVSLILYAEHGFNASTFTGRVVVSSLSDIYSGVTGAIGSLKGPLHGGANEAVMHMLLEIGEPARARDWMLAALASKRKIMGFGHRVYKNGDSRVPTMREALVRLVEHYQRQEMLDLYDALERAMAERKNIKPNLDYPSGPAYNLMGFDTETFTPLFAAARITGWTAHIFEQYAANSLIRPLSQYTGPAERHLER